MRSKRAKKGVYREMSNKPLDYKDLGFTDTAMKVLKERYLHKDPVTGEQETIIGMFNRVSKTVAQGDRKKQADYMAVMLDRYFLPNSPTLMNAGRSGRHGQLSACYVLPVEDSMDGIFSALKNQALIHKFGGGTGFNFSHLRPKGAAVNSTGGVATGPVSFMELFDMATEKVQQGGCRRGANMGILNIDHPDILDFITSKLSGDKLTNFNISVGMTDEFMQKVVDGTLDEREKEIWSTIITSAWRSGDPGLVFLGTINKKNKHPELGELEATNPCAECPLHDFEACNLGSINLSRFVTSTNTGVNDKLPIHLIDWDKLRRVVHIAVDFLNDVIDVNCYPLPEIAEAVRRSRKIGLGVMGWADMLNKLGVRYGSDESLFLAQQVMCFIHEEGHRASRGRNRCVTCIAPTGTISLIAGCSSGIEPLFALEYDRIAFAKDENADGSSRKQVLHYVDPEYLAARNNPEDRRIELGVFVTAQELSYQKHIKMQAAFQEYTDLAVSKTINLPNKATLEDIDKAYRMAWLSDCCGITVYRDGCKNVQVLYKTADDESQAEVCPECGSASVVRESGCKRCTQCGWSPCSV